MAPTALAMRGEVRVHEEADDRAPVRREESRPEAEPDHSADPQFGTTDRYARARPLFERGEL